MDLEETLDYWLGDFLGNIPSELPMILISLAGMIVVITLRKKLGRAALWASIGFALQLLVSVAIPASQTLAIYLISHQGLEPGSLAFALLWLMWCACARLVAAACWWRSRSGPGKRSEAGTQTSPRHQLHLPAGA